MVGKNNWQDADVARGEHAARVVLSELGIAHPTEVALDNIAYLRGALVVDMPLRGAQGRLLRLGTNATISVSSSIAYPQRRRFVIAHELGHLEIHRHVNQLEACDESKINELYDMGTEREANAFAGELLMPTALWRKRTDVRRPNLEVVAALADEFQVSFTAAAIRFVKLCPERCCVVFSQRGRVYWAAYSPDFGYRIEQRVKLDSYTLASDYFIKGNVTNRPETVSASAWINGPRIRSDEVLTEHCRPLPSLEAVLSLLWIPSDADF